MAAIVTAWMVGGVRLATSTTFTASGEPCTVPAGDYYLWDADPSLSLLHQIVAAVEASEIIGPGTLTAIVRRDRKVQFDYAGGIMSLQFPDVLATAIGFATTLYEDLASFVGEAVPALLWSPGWPETTEGSPVGVAGHKVFDRIMTTSPTGQSTNVTVHHSTRMVTVSWFFVRQDRAWTPNEAPGEFVDFFDRVIVPGHNMKLYSGVTEDSSSSVAVTWPTGLGPYVVPEPDYGWYRRAVANSDSLGANISFTMQVTGEYA